jgi:hypothetical protein
VCSLLRCFAYALVRIVGTSGSSSIFTTNWNILTALFTDAFIIENLFERQIGGLISLTLRSGRFFHLRWEQDLGFSYWHDYGSSSSLSNRLINADARGFVLSALHVWTRFLSGTEALCHQALLNVLRLDSYWLSFSKTQESMTFLRDRYKG